MERVDLGGADVSRIGYGCYGLGLGYSDNTPDDWAGLIRRAFDLGVNFFDTADQYGPAEEVLGRAIAPFRQRVFVATKVGVTGTGGRDTSPEHLRRSCDASLRRLGTDWIDLYQIHFDDPATPVAATVAALEELRAGGKIRSYGVGHLPAARVGEYLDLGRPATLLFELSLVARQARRDLLPFCRPGGPRGIAFSPTGRGLLTARAGPGHHAPGDIRALDPLFQREKLTSGLRIRDHLAELGRQLRKTPVQVAIAWTLAQPGVAVSLTGPSRLDHLEENLGGSGWTIPAGALAGLDRLLEQEDEWLRRESAGAARAITAGPPSRKDGCAYAELLYAMEVAVEYGLATETAVLPLVMNLLAKRKQTGGVYDPSLEEIRQSLAALITGD